MILIDLLHNGCIMTFYLSIFCFLFHRCIIRFPSTQIKLVFNSLLEDSGELSDVRPSSPLPPSSAFQSPYITPVPSPTGTIRLTSINKYGFVCLVVIIINSFSRYVIICCLHLYIVIS